MEEEEEEDVFCLFTNTAPSTPSNHPPINHFYPTLDHLLFPSHSNSPHNHHFNHPLHLFDPHKSHHFRPRKLSHPFSYNSDQNLPKDAQNSVHTSSVEVFDPFSYDSNENQAKKNLNSLQTSSAKVFDRFDDEKNENSLPSKVFDHVSYDSDEKELNSVQTSSVKDLDQFDDGKNVNSVPGKVFNRFSHDSDENEAIKDLNSVQSGSVKVFDRFSYSSDENEEKKSQVPLKVFDRFFYDSEEEKNDENDTVNIAGKRLDNMIQYLDTKLLNKDEKNEQTEIPLPEFSSKHSNGIFKVPVRTSKKNRPPSIELRPRPLRESQVGCFLRCFVTASDEKNGNLCELWGGMENGVRVWNLNEIYENWGREEGARYWESGKCGAVLCMVADAGTRVVWSGGVDGRIRCWKMATYFCEKGGEFVEVFSWQAHRGPVLSIAITSCGDIWSSSEGGVIMIWPWESIEKALSLTLEERHLAAISMERSYIDLKSQVLANAVSTNFTNDVKYILSDHSSGRVWTAGDTMFSLWDSRTRELLKVFNIDGQNENLSLAQDSSMEDEITLKYVSVSRKERLQSASNFFQRSRNALMGAADAVRRVAVKGSFGDDNRRTEALITTIDGMIWCGSSNGLIVQWDGNGNRLQDFQYYHVAVHCLATYGFRIWVGYASGTVQVLDLNGRILGEWVAHSNPIIDMSAGGGYLFTLSNHGGIRGWHITSPGPLDSILRSELSGKEFLYTRMEKLQILTGTWNVAQGRASHDSLISWLGSAAANVSIIVVGLQEVEMGAGFLAMSAARETVGLEGSTAGQWWLDMMDRTLDEGSSFERVGSRQLAGLLIAVWVRNNIRGHVGDVDVAAVPCGFGRAIGNKGAVGLRMRVYGRIMCFVNCHFAAHMEAVNRRNADFDHVWRTMAFSRPPSSLNSSAGIVLSLFLSCLFGCSMYVVYQLPYHSLLALALLIAAGVSSSIQMLRGANTLGINSIEGMPELSEADMVIFLGDFNYRLNDTSYDEARDFISQRSFDWLRERDQLRAEMNAGNVFQGMREAIIGFPPTYKFEKHQPGLAGYDSSEKRRIPAWCDRILYRDTRSASVSSCSLDCPVVSSITQYEACMDVTDSDHKPVRGIFSVEIARVDESIRRQEFGAIIKCNENIVNMLEQLSKVPDTIASTNTIILQNNDTSILRITNKSGKRNAFFQVICEGQSIISGDGQASDHHPRGSFGFPRWLEVSPASGIIKPNHIMEISFNHEKFHELEEFVDGVPQNWWCEDARDKEVILVVKVYGSCSTESKSHRIRVRHSLCGKPMHKASKGEPDFIHKQANLLRRSDFQHLSGSSDVVDHLRNLHSP